MSVRRRSLPTLQIPNDSRSPAGNSPTAQTGRPPLWTRSAQRKMSRLYLYTTLPITKILELIYSDSPHSAPGKDSANKKLNAMLDKEPRWLHPKTSTDMGRRVSQLPNSPMRSPLSETAPPPDWTHSSDLSPPLGSGSALNQSHPSTRHASPAGFWSASASAPASATNGQGYMPALPAFADNDGHSSRGGSASPGNDLAPEQTELLEDFLRRTTFMSSSTDHTTGSFRRVLGDSYPDVYIKTVRRLVKRFTMPNNNNNRNTDNRRSVSPISERAEQLQTSWLDDDDAPSIFNERPYPLPGDFLHMDAATRATFGVPDSPWMTSIAPTSDAHRLLSGGIMPTDVHVRDASGNTVLHFLTMRGSIDLILHALGTGYCTPILNAQNSAGQTFLHLVTWQWIKDFNHLDFLTRHLREMGFNFYARDHYGRNFFHVLLRENPDATPILQSFDQRLYAKRDAFGHVPGHVAALSGDQMDVDPQAADPLFDMNMGPNAARDLTNDSRLLRYVRHASEYPWLEDADGRNGLHCLAMVSLSVSQVSSRIGGVSSLAPAVPEGQRRRSQSHGSGLDSSEDRLALRHSQLTQLLHAGVDPNQYDLQGHTPLMVFAAELPEDDDYKTGPRILEALLDGGADIHARSRAGETALHVAVRCGRKLAVRTLVRRGANVFARDAAGRSVLDVADVKMANLSDDDPVAYAHYEACRAWLSGPGLAVQRPGVSQEWSVRPS